MLPSHIESLLRQQIATDIQTKATKLRQLQTRAAEKASKSGMVVAGLYVRELALEIQRRAALIAEAIRKVLTEIRLAPYSGLIPDLVALYDSEFDRMVSELRPLVMGARNTLPFKTGGDGGLGADLDDWRAEHRIDIKRLAAAIMEPALRANTVSINVHNSHIGILQTGDGTASIGAITLSHNETEALREALATVTRAIDAIPAPSNSKRTELREVIVEVEKEIAKATPNGTKLGGLLSTVVASIKGIETLQTAYQDLLNVLAKFGFDVQ